MSKKILIPFLFLLLGICSCTKDTVTDYPVVEITSPYSLATFNVPGTIQVTGYVSDSKSLTSVTVYIGNSQNIPVEQTITVPITSNTMNVSLTYYLDDIHMLSGQYYMTITASNGTNTASAFQQIYVDGTPTVRTAIYAISHNSGGVQVWKIDSLFHASLSYTVSGDYSSSDINSYYQQLYTAGLDSGNVNVYSVPNIASDWSLSGIVSTTPYFTNIYCNNDAEYVSYHLGYVKCYNHLGTLETIYNVNSGYYPVKTFAWAGWLFAEEKSIYSTSENLLTFYQASAAGAGQIVIQGPIVAMYGYDNNDIFVFGNSSGGAYMQLYNIRTNLFYSPVTMPSAKLLSVAQVNASTYLISFNNGTIYQYTYGQNGLFPYINGISASTLCYDNINNQIITATGNTINEYNYGINSANLVASAIISDSIRDLSVLYNK